MMRILLPLVVLAVLPFASCSSIKNLEMTLRGDIAQNRNGDGQATAVRVRVLRLKGVEAAQAFKDAPFDDVWADPIKAQNIVLDVPPQSLYVLPQAEPIIFKLENVPPEVTHIGVLGRFENPSPGKERLVLTRDELGSCEVAVRDYELVRGEPGGQAETPPKPEQPHN